MKKGKLLLVLGLLFAVTASGSPSFATFAAPFCSSNPGQQDIVGFGTSSQIEPHYITFIPSLEAKCKQSSGRISYFAGDEQTTFNRMLFRGPDFNDFDAFWSFDRPLSESEIAQAEADTGAVLGRYSQIGQFPLFVNGLAIAYNVNCASKPLNLSATNLSLIYLGVITNWDDPRLSADQDADQQAAWSACNKPIRLTGRADAAGETISVKQYMSSGNPIWNVYAQPQLNTEWPATATLVCRGGGDAGAQGCVASQTGSIGYVSIQGAYRFGLRVANMGSNQVHENGLSGVDLSHPTSSNVNEIVSGGPPSATPRAFVAPTLAGCTTAANSVVFPPGFDNYSDWNEAPLINATDGYPICFFSFLDLYKKEIAAYQGTITPGQSETIRDYLVTIFSGSVQSKLAAAGFGSLPRKILDMNLRGVTQIEMDKTCEVPVSIPPDFAVGPYSTPSQQVGPLRVPAVTADTDPTGCPYALVN